MSILALTTHELEKIAAAVARARQRPVPWKLLKRKVVDDRDAPNPYLKLSERKPGPRVLHPESVMLPVGYRLNISFEYQPAGLCQHISVSSPDPATSIPNEQALGMIVLACGMTWPPDDRTRIWVEDFVAGPMIGKAVNVVEVVEVAH